MTVCQYFLQGRCRFGQNCRLEHSYPTDDRNNRNPLNSQQLNTIVKKVAETVVLAEKGGQWPLSCFSPLKGGANIPGWDDYSPEEIRWKMYEGRTKGTLNQTTLEISQLYSNAEKMRNLLKEPTVERMKIITNLLKEKTEPSNVSNPFTSSNIFGGSVQTSGSQNIFGSASFPGSQGNIFGGSASTPGNQANIFGGAVTTTGNQENIFGGAAPATGSQGNIFGGSSQSSGSIFGGAGNFSNANIFGNAVSSSAFSQSPLPNAQNAAPGGSINIFQRPSVSSQNIFSTAGEGNNQNVANAFLSQNVSSIFSNSSSNPIFESKKVENESPNQFSFHSSQNENIFKTQNSFGKTEMFNTQSAKNVFGSSSQAKAFGGGQQIPKEFDISIYSKPEDLSEEEIKSFTSTTFTFGKIPLKPPPQNYCK